MHHSGVRASNEQYRNGELLRSADVDFFDFDEQGVTSVIQEPYTVKPGDSFRLSCFFDSMNKTFGKEGTNEMCDVFIGYYPRQVAPPGFNFMCGPGMGTRVCDSVWEPTLLNNSGLLERQFGSSGRTCSFLGTTVGDISLGGVLIVLVALASIGFFLFASLRGEKVPQPEYHASVNIA